MKKYCAVIFFLVMVLSGCSSRIIEQNVTLNNIEVQENAQTELLKEQNKILNKLLLALTNSLTADSIKGEYDKKRWNVK